MATMTCPVCNQTKEERKNALVCSACMNTPEGLKHRRMVNIQKTNLKKRGYTAERKAAGLPDPRTKKKATARQVIRCELCGKESLVVRQIEHLCVVCRETAEGMRYMRDKLRKYCAELKAGTRAPGLIGKPEIVGVLPSAPDYVRDEYPLMRGRVLPDTMGWVDYEGYVFRQNNLTYASVGGRKVLL